MLLVDGSAYCFHDERNAVVNQWLAYGSKLVSKWLICCECCYNRITVFKSQDNSLTCAAWRVGAGLQVSCVKHKYAFAVGLGKLSC